MGSGGTQTISRFVGAGVYLYHRGAAVVTARPEYVRITSGGTVRGALTALRTVRSLRVVTSWDGSGQAACSVSAGVARVVGDRALMHVQHVVAAQVPSG